MIRLTPLALPLAADSFTANGPTNSARRRMSGEIRRLPEFVEQ